MLRPEHSRSRLFPAVSISSGDAARFLRSVAAVDGLGRRIDSAPWDRAALRLLWSLVHLGVLPVDAAHDPWGPSLGQAEFARLGAGLSRVDPDLGEGR